MIGFPHMPPKRVVIPNFDAEISTKLSELKAAMAGAAAIQVQLDLLKTEVAAITEKIATMDTKLDTIAEKQP